MSGWVQIRLPILKFSDFEIRLSYMNGLSISDIANGVNFEILHAWPHNVTFLIPKTVRFILRKVPAFH